MRCRAARALVFRLDLHAIGGHCRDNMNLVADADFELAAVAGDQERVRASDGDLRDDWLTGSRTDVRCRGLQLERLSRRGGKDHRAALKNRDRSEEHTSELQSRLHLVCRLLLEKKKNM